MAASTAGRWSRAGELGPCFPEEDARDALLEKAAALLAEGHRLEAANGQLAAALRPLVRTMNACHSSELDGLPLRPVDIERANAGQLDEDPASARAQRLARAHVAAEAVLSAALPTKRVGLYAPEFVQCIHAELHRSALSPEERAAQEEAEGEEEIDLETLASSVACEGSVPPIESGTLSLAPVPGAWRLSPAPRPDAPAAEDIPALLDTWQGMYSKPFALEHAVVAALCAQHRLLWVRPFAHGNGRTARLHTHLVLTALGVTSELWSPLRGMARDRDGYQARLRPPSPRELDLKGDAGAAAREQLESFVSWLLDVCLAEAQAARDLLDTERLKGRLGDLLSWLAARPWVMGSEKSVVKPDALEALHYAAITGPVERARFIAMLGLQHRTGRRVLSSLLDFGILVSESTRAPVRFNLSPAALRFVLPGFWSDPAVEEPGSAPAAPLASGWPAAEGAPSTSESAAE